MAPEAQEYDVVIVGGGTAGCVVARRLSDDPARSVCVVEGGPTDVGDERVLRLRNWINLIGTELDYDYGTVEQPMGNSHIRHSRARVLGGCSSHNTMISFAPLPADLDGWEAAGATGWGYEAMRTYYDRRLMTFQPAAAADRNPICDAFNDACAKALGVPVVDDFNAVPFVDGAGYLSIGYDPATGHRNSSSVSYLHDVLDSRPNLDIQFESRALRLRLESGRATGVEVRRSDGSVESVRLAPGGELVLAAGAVDTPRILMLSGIGRAEELRRAGIEPVVDLPGVGEHLLDHPEGIILWEAARPLPPQSVMDSDVGLFLRRDTSLDAPDLMFHLYMIPFTFNTERLGYPVVEHGFGMTPNIPRPRSFGRMWLNSADPDEKPGLDFGYLTDPDGYDVRTLVDGLRTAREVAATAPFADWIAREVAPSPALTTDAELAEYARRSHHTVYHPAGTCRMGAADDPLSVVTPDLRLKGVAGVRIADASVFPVMTSVNPMVTVVMVGEKAADLIAGTPNPE